MSVNQGYREGIKKTAKFFWRHFFMLVILSIGFSAFIEGPLNWKNGFYMVIVSILLDWSKTFIKITPNKNFYSRTINTSDDISTPLHTRQWWNSSIPGTPTNLMNNSYPRY